MTQYMPCNKMRTSMCTKFGENPSSSAEEIVFTRITEFKLIWGHNSGNWNTCRTTFISPQANLNITKSMCTKFGENPSSGVGGVALTRFTKFKVIRGYNSGNTFRITFSPFLYMYTFVHAFVQSLVKICSMMWKKLH